MIAIPTAFREMPRWWGDGTDWLDVLPSLVEDQCRRWDLTPTGEVRHGSNALVAAVRRRGEPLALRLSPPGDDVAREAAALRFWDGRGTVRLLDADPERRAQLLEWISPGTPLASMPLPGTAPIIAAMITRLAVPAPDDVPSTGDVIAADLDGWPSRWASLGGPGSARLLDAALQAAADTTRPETPQRAVNGDLHFDQVLRAEREPWLVVDPVLLRGDIGYDLGRLLWSRLDEMPVERDVRRYLERVVEAAGLDLERAERLVVARAMSYLLWGLEHGLTEDPPRCRRLLEIFAVRRAQRPGP